MTEVWSETRTLRRGLDLLGSAVLGGKQLTAHRTLSVGRRSADHLHVRYIMMSHYSLDSHVEIQWDLKK